MFWLFGAKLFNVVHFWANHSVEISILRMCLLIRGFLKIWEQVKQGDQNKLIHGFLFFFSCASRFGSRSLVLKVGTNWILMSCSFNNQPNRESRMGRLQKAFDMRHLTYQIFLTCNIWISHRFISSWVWCIIDVVNWFLTSWQVNTVQITRNIQDYNQSILVWLVIDSHKIRTLQTTRNEHD